MEQVVEILITCSSSVQRVIRVGAGDCLMFVEISFKKKNTVCGSGIWRRGWSLGLSQLTWYLRDYTINFGEKLIFFAHL